MTEYQNPIRTPHTITITWEQLEEIVSKIDDRIAHIQNRSDYTYLRPGTFNITNFLFQELGLPISDRDKQDIETYFPEKKRE
jgi:hypothetical protein